MTKKYFHVVAMMQLTMGITTNIVEILIQELISLHVSKRFQLQSQLSDLMMIPMLAKLTLTTLSLLNETIHIAAKGPAPLIN